MCPRGRPSPGGGGVQYNTVQYAVQYSTWRQGVYSTVQYLEAGGVSHPEAAGGHGGPGAVQGVEAEQRGGLRHAGAGLMLTDTQQ